MVRVTAVIAGHEGNVATAADMEQKVLVTSTVTGLDAARDARHEDAETSADALTMLAFVAQRRGDRTTALSLMQRAVQADPRNAQRHIDLALLALEVGAYYEAIAHFEVVLAGCGELPVALLGLGRALMEAKQWELAADRLERAVHAAPSSAQAWSELGQTYIELGRYEAAMAALEAAAKHAPEDVFVVRRLARALILAGRPQQAEPLVLAALHALPSDADAWLVLGDIQFALGCADDALASYQRAAALQPEVDSIQQALADAELSVGHYAQAWQRLAQPWKQEQSDTGLPLWDGVENDATTLFVTECASAADTLLLSRYLAEACSRVGRLVLLCEAGRAELFARSFPEIVVARDAMVEEREHVCTTSLDGLPGLLQVQGPSSVSTSYLRADETRVRAIRERQQDRRLRVGLCWQGFDKPSERHHTMHLSRLLPLLSLEQIQCVSLQRGAAAEQVQALPAQFSLQSLESFVGAACSEMDQLAVAIDALDLIITVDGEVAHLSGALGRPTWVMLANTPRPLLGLTERNWYRDVRVFRQDRRNDYGGVVSAVRAALRERIAAHKSPLDSD